MLHVFCFPAIGNITSQPPADTSSESPESEGGAVGGAFPVSCPASHPASSAGPSQKTTSPFSRKSTEHGDSGSQLVRNLSHCVHQTLEMALGPDHVAHKKCWRNIGSKYGVDNDTLDYLASCAPRTKVTDMFRNCDEFHAYTLAQLKKDLLEFGRKDVLEKLHKKHAL